MIDASGLSLTLVYSSSLVGGLIFRVVPWFRYCMMVIASSKCLLQGHFNFSCFCIGLVGFILLLLAL